MIGLEDKNTMLYMPFHNDSLLQQLDASIRKRVVEDIVTVIQENPDVPSWKDYGTDIRHWLSRAS